MAQYLSPELIALIQIIIIDLVLAGDNAIVVGMAASRLPAELRKKVIFWGVAGAVGLRILFAIVATHLLAIVGLSLAGGILLLWVCWKMYREIVRPAEAHVIETSKDGKKVGFWNALIQIIVADVSMSLDNVLAVAGAAKGNVWILVTGLALAIIMMALIASWLAKLLGRYHWITWIGLLVILQVALDMIWDGSHEVACQFVPKAICDNGWIATMRSLVGI
ncbi:MAG TPA: TerC family protein [Xanthobacteraceae bacterium]|jgi:YjbE family integral membrane protein|nr:TerC family protein [Xanthobacteraceae bacterium]